MILAWEVGDRSDATALESMDDLRGRQSRSVLVRSQNHLQASKVKVRHDLGVARKDIGGVACYRRHRTANDGFPAGP